MSRARTCLALLLAACGTAAGPTPAGPREQLGAQSNVSATPITLRLAPAAPIAFATELRVSIDSELLGEPLSADFDWRGIRRITEVRPDGSIAIEEIETATRYSMTMVGNTRAGPEPGQPPRPPRRYVVSDRGRREPEPAVPSPGAPPASGPMPDLVQGRLESAFEPLLRALEFPEHAVIVGDEWSAEGRIDLADFDPSMRGGGLYRITQRFDRLEGSGERRLAIVAFVVTIEGSSSAGGAGSLDGEISGEVRIEGFYAVALIDGFARTARARVRGEARLGPEEIMRFPIEGDIAWDAVPISP